jgi:DNA polymerase IV (family X)
MNKKELARALKHAADLMEVLGEGEFRVLAYRRAARALEATQEPLEDLAARGFKGVRGIGSSLAALLGEVYETGEFPYLEELEGRLPPGARELFSVQGLGPKKIRLLLKEGIISIEALLAAAEAGKLSALPGFGKKTEEKLKEAARFALKSARRVLLPVGLEVAGRLLEDLRGAGIRAELAGSLRRGLETVGGVDLVAEATAEEVTRALGEHAERGEGGVVYGSAEGLALKVFLTEPERFGTTWVRATGSAPYVEALGPLPEVETEGAVFSALGRPTPAPFFRESEHTGLPLPERFLAREDLKGLIHLHTTYSDGAETLEAMARSAAREGYAYMVVTDHSQTAAYAGG